MEKYVVFGPIIVFFAIFALLVIGFFILVGKLIFKAKSDSWVGEVIDKGHNTKRDSSSNKIEHFYFFKVRIENGEEHNIATSQKFFNEIKVGDKLKKEKGSLWPKKTS